jgi:hypothetical protein
MAMQGLPAPSVYVLSAAIAVLLLWLSLAAYLRCRPLPLLMKGSLYFVPPIVVAILIEKFLPALLIIVLLLLIPLEESFKLVAAKSRRDDPRQAFLLVSLFGFFELLIAKLWLTLNGYGQTTADVSAIELSSFTTFMTLPVLMHSATGAIYAFFPGRRGYRFWTCVLIHWLFNQSRAIYFLHSRELTPETFSAPGPLTTLALDAIVLIACNVALLRSALRPRDGSG